MKILIIVIGIFFTLTNTSSALDYCQSDNDSCDSPSYEINIALFNSNNQAVLVVQTEGILERYELNLDFPISSKLLENPNMLSLQSKVERAQLQAVENESSIVIKVRYDYPDCGEGMVLIQNLKNGCIESDSFTNWKDVAKITKRNDQQIRFQLPGSNFKHFNDISHESDYYNSSLFLKLNNIIRGYDDHTYKPDAYINRAEFTKILIKAAGFDELQIADCELQRVFPDVQNNDWFAPYICKAKERGWINGYPDPSASSGQALLFKPANNINIAEAAKIVANAFNLEQESHKADVWYEPYIRALEDLNAMPNSIQSNDQLLTRGEMAEVIYRVMTHKNDE